jgi:leader peptidase (prepilin peptidase) / N-methyltransferase
LAEQTTEAKPSAGIGRSEPLRLVVGVAMIALWVADLIVHHSNVQKVLGLVLIAVLARVTITDIEQRRIRNTLMIAASFAALAIGLVMHPGGLPAQVLWAIGAGAFGLFFAIVSRGGLGMGDVKLSFVLGLFLSRYVVYAVAIGLLAAAIFGIAVMISRGLAAGRKTYIPLGPFLALGGAVAVLAGPWLLTAT